MQASTLRRVLLAVILAALPCTAGGQPGTAQQTIAQVDAAVRQRSEHLAGYTVVEHYTVFRNGEQSKPMAEMTVKTTFRRETGKSYQVVSESGSGMILRFGLKPLLENERVINLPQNREQALFTSANYTMEPLPGAVERNGRSCTMVKISPRRAGSNLLNGTLWVDAADGSIVHIEGTRSKNSSLMSGPARMTRDYAPQQGFAMAMHARAETENLLFGKVVVTIDYTDYKLEATPAR